MANKKKKKPKKILIMDDNPFEVNWLEDCIEKEKAIITYAETYEAAVKSIENSRPDIIVVDIMIGAAELKGKPIDFDGAALKDVPNTWQGLKLLRYVRAVKRYKKNQVSLVVYTVIESKALYDLVRTFEAFYCTKTDADEFEERILKLIDA